VLKRSFSPFWTVGAGTCTFWATLIICLFVQGCTNFPKICHSIQNGCARRGTRSRFHTVFHIFEGWLVGWLKGMMKYAVYCSERRSNQRFERSNRTPYTSHYRVRCCGRDSNRMPHTEYMSKVFEWINLRGTWCICAHVKKTLLCLVDQVENGEMVVACGTYRWRRETQTRLCLGNLKEKTFWKTKS